MNWTPLTSEQELQLLLKESHSQPILLFKHSTSCNISTTAKARLERKWKDTDNATVKPVYLDLLNYRAISQKIAELTGVRHESPQAIVLKDGKATYNASHSGIYYDDILAASQGV